MNERETKSGFPDIALLVKSAVERWQQTEPVFPFFGKPCSPSQQQRREALLDRYVKDLLRTLRPPGNPDLNCLTSGVVSLSMCAMCLDHSEIEDLLRNGFSEVGIALTRWARRLDPGITTADIFQACRNAWTACGLQVLFGKKLRLTPAIFGYSMLYPYTDNFLDDPAVPKHVKQRFNDRFGRRLSGENIEPVDAQESIVCHLIGLIESEYPRRSYPEVYQALLAIYHAQRDSLRQLQSRLRGDPDLLPLTVRKGGTSVLADAWLAAGTLSDSEIKFAFDWGVLLQLTDDLQDLTEDSARGSLTLFSEAHEPLDALTSRLFQLGDRILKRVSSLTHGTEVLELLLTRSWQLLMLRSVAEAHEQYTPGFVTALERQSPVTFEFLRNRQNKFTAQNELYAGAVERLFSAEENRGAREADLPQFQSERNPQRLRESFLPG